MAAISTAREGATLVVVIDRPSVANAFDRSAAEELSSVIDRLESDDELRVAVLTGNGSFSAGQDLAAVRAGEGVASSAGRGAFGIIGTPPRKPVIAAVERHALGGGLELCLACDLVIASRTAKMGLPEVRRGLVAKAGGLVDLGRVLPRHIALEVLLTGRIYPAEFFHRWGLVNELVEPGEAVAKALDWAAEIAANGPLAVRYSKQVFLEAADWPRNERWARQDAVIGGLGGTEDAKEGVAAFMEKRAPVWKGR